MALYTSHGKVEPCIQIFPHKVTNMPLFGCSGAQTVTDRSINQQQGPFNMAKGRKVKVGGGGAFFAFPA